MIIGSLQTTLGDLVESGEGFIQTGPFGSQLHAHDYVENGIPIVMPQQLGDNEISEYGISQINGQDRDRLIRHVMRVGDIVFSRRGDVTRRAYITGKEDGWLCGTGCFLLRLNHPQCDNSYLVRFLGLHETRSYLTQHAIGATMPNLNQRILASVPVVLPPREHQERIIGVVSAYDDLIENNRRRIRLLEQAARLLYKEWFVHLRFLGHEHVKIKDGVPEGWERKPLGEIVETNAESYKAGELPDYINYTDISSVKLGRIVAKNLMSSVEAPGRARRKAKSGDTIWSNVRPNLRAYALVLNPEENDVFSTGFTVLSPVSFPFTYLYLLVTTDEFVGHLANHATGAGYPAVRADDFERAIVLVPSDQILRLFQNRTESIYRFMYTLEKEMRSLSQTRDLLLPRLMNGEITI